MLIVVTQLPHSTGKGMKLEDMASYFKFLKLTESDSGLFKGNSQLLPLSACSDDQYDSIEAMSVTEWKSFKETT